MSQNPKDPKTFKASDGKVYSSDGLYVLEGKDWILRASPSATSSSSGTHLATSQNSKNPETFKASDGKVYSSDGLYVLEGKDWILRASPPAASSSSTTSTTLPAGSSSSATPLNPAGNIYQQGLFQPTGLSSYPYFRLDPATKAAGLKDPFSAAFVAAWEAVAGPDPDKKP